MPAMTRSTISERRSGAVRSPRATLVLDRFWSKVRKTDGCWEWTGAPKRGGYGQFHLGHADGRQSVVAVHRFAYEVSMRVLVPAHLNVCHKCDNPKCVRPDHMFIGTQSENLRDMQRKDRAKHTHCKRGHALTPDNIDWHGEKRRCLICRNAYVSRRTKEARRAA